MQDYIKDLILRIEQLENMEDEASALELSKLYGKMKKAGFYWEVKANKWVLKGEKND